MLLYVCTNDGSDMRINKEIKSLYKRIDIIFIGVGETTNCYVTSYCKKIILVKGKRNSFPVLLKLIFYFLKVLITKKIKTIHIINEQLYIFFYPFLFFKHTVLDLFDSFFLRKNLIHKRFNWLKRLIYIPANRILVTDENRFNLMPKALRTKCLVLPNFPEYFRSTVLKEPSLNLRILYNGWMGLNRGTEIVEGLLKTKCPVKIYMAGWFSDEYTKLLLDKYPDNIEFLGVIPQSCSLEIAQKRADYILCVYAPVNQNNINASPNKVYDAIQTSTPLIINAETKISDWVRDKGIGFILPRYKVKDFTDLYHSLIKAKEAFGFDKDLKAEYTWENIEGTLLKAHKV
jgi:hypothetical protein